MPEAGAHMEVKSSSWRSARFLVTLLRARLAVVGLVLLCGLVVLAVAGPALAGGDPNELNLVGRLQPPLGFGGSPAHPLGTDGLGRDILRRVALGARVSLSVAVSAVAISCVLGVAAGLVSGYFGGLVDDVLMRLADVQLAFPAIILFIGVLAALGPGVGNLVAVLGLSGWVLYGRVVRGETLSLREREFVIAARAIGARHPRVIARHILPNVMAPVIVLATFSAAGVVIAEASLSFLGLGVPVTVASWGSMLADGQDTLRQAWWPATIPGLAIMLAALSVNSLGDWLRDYLDPRMRV
jgi:peptide/nickel transport system permease protein